MKRTSFKAIACSISLGLAASAMPGDAGATTAASPSLGGLLDAAGLAISGYLDAAYEYQSGTGLFSSGTPDRVFDTRANSFTLHQAAITISRQPKQGWGAVVNLTAGQDAEVIKSYPVTGGSNFDVTQAFVQYATGPVTLMLGKFVTLAGVEVIASPMNVNFSRSILFGYAIPFTHTGLRATYAVNGHWTIDLGVNNGWDQVSDANKQKTIEYGLDYTPAPTMNFAVQGYVGREPLAITNNVPSTAQGQRFLLDAIATWNVTAKWTLIANYDYGRQKDDSPGAAIASYDWDGVALYSNYQLAPAWQLSVRGEYFDDRNGYRTGVVDSKTGAGQKWKEVTATLNYAPAADVLLRLEGRYDRSNVADAFIESQRVATDPAGAGTVYGDHVYSTALEAIYKF